MAKLYFRYGVMGSGKTANAMMVRYHYEERVICSCIRLCRLHWRTGDLGPEGSAK